MWPQLVMTLRDSESSWCVGDRQKSAQSRRMTLLLLLWLLVMVMGAPTEGAQPGEPGRRRRARSVLGMRGSACACTGDLDLHWLWGAPAAAARAAREDTAAALHWLSGARWCSMCRHTRRWRHRGRVSRGRDAGSAGSSDGLQPHQLG